MSTSMNFAKNELNFKIPPPSTITAHNPGDLRLYTKPQTHERMYSTITYMHMY